MFASILFKAFGFPSPTQKLKDWTIQTYNFTCCSAWVWNLVSHTKGKTKIEEFWGENLNPRGRKWREAGEDYIMRSFITCTLRHTWLGWSNQGAEVHGTCSTHGRDEKCIQNFGRELKGRALENLDVDRRIILEWILGKQDGVLWIGFTWLRVQWRALLNTVMNLRVP
jgi:hypothetical protein